MERNGLVAGVLGLTCTVAACSKEPLVGEWELSSLTAQAYPAYSFYDEYCGYAEVSYSAVTQGRGSIALG